MPRTGTFSPDLFRFLAELKKHNERDWFLRNKPRYEAVVRDPFLRLIAGLEPKLGKLAPHLVVDPRPVGGSMFRIYRDTRFARDKSPYKTHVSAHFPHDSGAEGSPGLYLHLEPRGSFMATGIWHPEAQALHKVRQAIVDDPAAWQSLRRTRGFEMVTHMTEPLKRPPPGFDPAHPLMEDLKRKEFALSAKFTDKEVCGAGFLGLLLKRLGQAKPFTKFLANAVGLPF